MITPGAIWSQYRSALLGVIITGSLSLAGYGAKSWADNNYQAKGDLEKAVKARDLKDINTKLDALELEIQRNRIWLRFLPSDADIERQIYGAEIELLEKEKLRFKRERQDALTRLGAIIESGDE